MNSKQKPDHPLYVLKFGGSSLSDAGRIRRAVDIVIQKLREAKVAVVVSAFGGVTDELIRLIREAGSGGDWKTGYDRLKERHLTVAGELLDEDVSIPDLSGVHQLLVRLESELAGIEGKKTIGEEQYDLILSFGERISSAVFAAVLRKAGHEAQSFESQNFIRTNARFGEADVDSELTLKLIHQNLGALNGTIPVVTGFIGGTEKQQITTLGRSGSDYTAGLLGEALKAGRVEIWTDVSGVLTADPNIAPTAVTIPKLHYSEIAEMAHFGTQVLHPRTVLPLKQINIPIHIKNSFKPEAAGTVINSEFRRNNGRLSSVSVKRDICLIGLKSKGLDRIDRLSPRVLQALADAGISIFFNTSASSDYGVSVVVDAGRKKEADDVLKQAFERELSSGLIEAPKLYTDINMITVIGENLEKDLGLSGAVLSVLGENSIAPLSTARGVANRHLSLIVRDDETQRAVRLLNDHFCIHNKRLRLFVAGVGTIGGEFIKQTNSLTGQHVDLSIIGLCNSKKTLWDPAGLGSDAVSKLTEEGEGTDWERIVDHLIRDYPYRTVFVDATGNSEVARLYGRLLKAGIHIATPSKRAVTFEQSYYDELSGYTNGSNTHFFFETAVGAGLPVIQTISDLQAGGDTIEHISGVVSGTMTYIFGQLEQGRSFGEAVRNAGKLGYSEPDPRDDLSGEDVARKFMILARISGHKVERADVVVENLTPASLQNVTTEAFLEHISDYDDEWNAKVKQASEEGNVLRYVGEFKDGKIQIHVQAVPTDSPLGSLKGSDNQIIIGTKRYNNSPLIIQGPGAGKEVTAAGLLTDVKKITRLVF